MSSATKRTGFTLIEALVSATLISVGLVTIMAAYYKIAMDQDVAVKGEYMQRLALDKYDELVATQAIQTQALNGDFSDRGEDNYLWQATVTATGTDTLSALTVTVTSRLDTTNTTQGVVNGVVYQPPLTTTVSGAGAPTP